MERDFDNIGKRLTFRHEGLNFNGKPITVTHTHTPGLLTHKMTVEHEGRSLDLDLSGVRPGVPDEAYPVSKRGGHQIRISRKKMSELDVEALLKQPNIRKKVEQFVGSNPKKGTAAEETNRLMQKIVDVISEQNKKGFR